MDVITEGKKIQNELVELRRYFHEHPELPWEEFNTQKKIMDSEFHTRSPARPA